MKYLTLVHIALIVFLSSGINYCARDVYEGAAPRLLVKESGTPDSKYSAELYVYLSGYKGSSTIVDINTSHQWFLDEPSLYSVPNWCQVSLPSGVLTGFVTDKTIHFTTKGNNAKPFAQQFELILRHSQDPDVKVKIHVIQNIKGDELAITDYENGDIIQKYKTTGWMSFIGSGEQANGAEVQYFVVNTPKAWKLIVRPTALNAGEPASPWISIGLADGSVLAQADGNNIGFSCAQTGAVVVKMTIQPNASNRYPRYAEMEITAGTVANLDAVKIPIKQQTANAYIEFIYNQSVLSPHSLGFVALTQDDVEVVVPLQKTVNTNSNRNWTAAVPAAAAGWLSMVPMSASLDPVTGEAIQDVVITVAPNPSLTNTRQATINFTGSYIRQGVRVQDLTESLTINQAAKTLVFTTTVLASAYSFTSGNSGQSIAKTFNISSNHHWTITLKSGNTDKFVITPNELNHDQQTVNQSVSVYPIAKNTTTTALNAVYTITCANQACDFTVTQAAFVPYLTDLSASSLPQFAGTNALEQIITFKCNFDIDIEAPAWIQKSLRGPAGANGDEYALTVRAIDNTSATNSKPAENIEIKAQNAAYSSYNKTVSVSQDKKWWITVTPSHEGSLSFGKGSGLSTPPASQQLRIQGYIKDAAWKVSYVGTSRFPANFRQFAIAPATSSTNLLTVNGDNSLMNIAINVQPTRVFWSGHSWTVTISVSDLRMSSPLTSIVYIKQD